MKRYTILLTAVLAAVILTVSCAVFASSADMSATLSGPSVVRAGDTVTLTFALNGKGVEGASGELSYDTNQLTFSKTKQSIASPWAVEFSGNNMVAYDNDLSKPINKATDLFTVTFKVKSSLAVGTSVTVSVKNTKISDGQNEANAGTVSYTVKIAAPLSGDCTLSALTVSNAELSPAFGKNVTEYTASVPFAVEKLDLKATASDSSAKVTISNPTLKVNGKTDVTVTVKAASGAEKIYTIVVTRAQDPNYQPSGENTLSGITVRDFFLSPKFSPDVTKYVVWLPYETESVSVTAQPKDVNASFRVEGADSLKAGADNEIKVICIAENGSEKAYTLIAKRAADPNAAGESTDTAADPESDSGSVSEAGETTADTEAVTDPSGTTADTTVSAADEKSKQNIIPTAIAGVVGLVLGFVLGKIGKKKR